MMTPDEARTYAGAWAKQAAAIAAAVAIGWFLHWVWIQ